MVDAGRIELPSSNRYDKNLRACPVLKATGNIGRPVKDTSTILF